MDEHTEKIWHKAKALLAKAVRKDFVVHTKAVVEAMEALIEGEGGDDSVLIPAAMLHDVGWSQVPSALQTTKDKKEDELALEMHIAKAPQVAGRVLRECGFSQVKIERIIRIIIAHKSNPPKSEKEKQMLIDADALSDTFKKPFYADCKAYGTTPQQNLEFRSKNEYYTKTAKEISRRNLLERKKEISGVTGI